MTNSVNKKDIEPAAVRTRQDFFRKFVEILAFAIIYYLTARAGLFLAIEGTNASPVWPPSGIALATILVFGRHLWPGITAGAFFANFTVFFENQTAGLSSILGASAIISMGNTLEALTGAWLVRRFIGGAGPFERFGENLKFFGIALLACLTSSLIGPASLSALGIISWKIFPPVWFTWWLGDSIGILLLTPTTLLLVKWAREPIVFWEPKRVIEAVFVFVLLIAAGQMIFGDFFGLGAAHYPLEFFLLPFILWAGFRFGQGGVLLTIVLASATTISGTIRGLGPFVRATQNESLLLLQAFTGAVTMIGLLVASLVAERKRSEEMLRKTQSNLEKRIEERTAQLREINESLKNEITERQRVEEEMHKAYRELEKGQEAALNIMEDLERQKKELHKTNVALVAEINERQRMAEALKASESRFRRLAESNLLGIIVTDLEGQILDANDAFLRMTGFSHEEMRLGKLRGKEMTPPEWGESDQQAMKQLKTYRIARPWEKEYLRKDGGRVPVLLGAAMLEGSEKECICFVLDQTERRRAKEARQELDQKKVELARTEAEREQLELFTFVASHDLQEPLHKIVAFGDLLQAHLAGRDPKTQDYVERMQNAATRMSQLIQDLLNFSRVTTKTDPFERVALSEVIENILKDLDLRIKETGAEFEIDSLPPVRGDRAQLNQLFQNLISNALKFIKPGETPRIAIRSRMREQNTAEISIQDNGVGFDEKYLDRIFRPFERLHSQSEYRGSGMGLAICHRIAVRHGGTITAKSAEGRGSTFIVALPLENASPAAP